MSHFTSRIRPMSQQAATFSRSTGEPNELAKWEAVLGPLPDQGKPNAYSHYPITNKQLPDAYIGQNVFLSEKVAGLIATTGAFWTSVLLPWLRSDHIGPFRWSKWEFNQVLATRVPHESVARLVTTEEREYQVRPVRRGLAMQMEGDFVNNPNGQLMFARNIQGMVASIQTTIDFDVQHSILTANDQRKLEHHRIGVNSLPIKEELDIEKDMFASISKSIDHFKMMVKRAEVMLMDNGASPPFTLLVTPEAIMDMSYFTKPTVEPQRLIGGGGGGAGDPSGELGRADLPVGDFVTPDGTAVFQVRAINFGSKGAPYQMFSKPTLIAEYYHMNWARYQGANLYDGCSKAAGYVYESDMRSILIKNETTDKMAKVTLAEALKHGGRINGETTGFPDMDLILELATRGNYKPSDFDPSVDPVTGEPVPEMMHNMIRRNVHMMLTRGLAQSAHKVRVVHYIGQMDSNVTSAKNIEQMAQTLLAHIPGISPKDVETAYELIELVKTLEDAEYNEAFFKELIAVNSPRNWGVATRGGYNFVGAVLQDEKHRQKWNTPSGYVEWRPNSDGGMTLPNWNPATMGEKAVPPGIANFPGLLSLRNLKNVESGYGDLPEKADRAVQLISKLGVGLSGAFASEAMDATNRAPWHLKANPLTTLFETAINVPRDPLFLMAVPVAGGSSTSPDFGGPSRVPSTAAVQSLQRVTLVSALNNGLRTSSRALNELTDALGTDGDVTSSNVFFAQGTPLTGSTIVAGDASTLAGLALSPTVTALRKLGTNSAIAYIDINKQFLLGEDQTDLRFALAGLINSSGTSPESAKYIVIGLEELVKGKSPVEAVDIITKIAVNNNKRAISSAMKKGKASDKSANDTALVEIFSSEGSIPNAVEAVLRTGVQPGDFAGEPTLLPQLANAVDRILATINLIHQERENVAASTDTDYNKFAYVYAFPGSGITVEDNRNVKTMQIGDTDEIKGLLRTLENNESVYEDLARLVLGGLPGTFGGLSGEIHADASRSAESTPETPGEARPMFSEAAYKAARYYRSSLVMTPGIAHSFGKHAYPLVRPSDPASGHLEPWAGGGETLPDRLFRRPQYQSFVGSEFQRSFEHSIWNSHHLEFLSSQKYAASQGRGRTTRYSDMFAGTSVPQGSGTTLDDDIFGDAEVVEGLLSGGMMPVAAHGRTKLGVDTWSGPSWDYDYPDPGSTKGRARPFAGYAGFDASVLQDGDKQVDDGSGAWLINNMNVGSIKYHIAQTNNIGNPLTRWVAMAIIVSRIDHIDYWLAMISSNVLVPCNVLLVRPAIEYVMDNFVLMKAGTETGGTLFNHSSAMLGWDVITRMIYLNYLFYSKAFVWGPENIYVLENVMPRRYIAGCGINWITDIAHLSTAQSHQRHDLLAIVLPIEEVRFDEDIGILGNRNEVYGDANPEFDGPMETKQYSSADYVKLWLRNPATASIERMLHEHKSKRVEYFRSIGTVPPVISQGYYQSWGTKAFDEFHAGQGHKGDYNDYEGSRKVWNRRGTPYFAKRNEQQLVINK